MNKTLVCQLPPRGGNPRNSEGAFIRAQDGRILFAYSRYCGDSFHDHASCDIWIMSSHDEGATWSQPKELVKASFFGVDNIMSVSTVTQKDGAIGIYFLTKENDMSTTLCRAISYDGDSFTFERCNCLAKVGYYVINNDRIVRLKDGTLVAPAAAYTLEGIRNYEIKRPRAVTTLWVSDDDGRTWRPTDVSLTVACDAGGDRGLQEPGIIEREDGLYMFMRTGLHCQYESFSAEGVNGFKTVRPSVFSSPNSPMLIKAFDGVMYAVYNPTPRYDGRIEAEGTMGRTPFVIRKSTDGGKSWGKLNTIASDPTRGYCYPAIFKTDDNHLLIAHCMGDAIDGNTLCRLGIQRIEIESIE